jgi:hypothetical protein
MRHNQKSVGVPVKYSMIEPSGFFVFSDVPNRNSAIVNINNKIFNENLKITHIPFIKNRKTDGAFNCFILNPWLKSS